MVSKFSCIFITLLLSLSLLGCSMGVKQAELHRPEISGLKLAAVQSATTGGYEVAGTVKGAQAVSMAPQTTGRVSGVFAREGDVVQAGQAIVVLSAPDAVQRTLGAEQQVAAAAAARKLAEATYNRTLSLYQSNAVSRQELDRALAAKDEAAATEKLARASVLEASSVEGYLAIRAPYTGVITRQLAEVGQLVSPSQVLVAMENASRYEVEAWVDVSQAGKVKPGLTVELRPSGHQGLVSKGTVIFVSPGATPDARSFLVKIAVPGATWRSGEYVQVRFPFAGVNHLTVPQSAIAEKGELTGVYVVGEDKVISYRIVRLGRTEGGSVEILAGLTGQEKIIVGDVSRAKDGAVYKEDQQ